MFLAEFDTNAWYPCDLGFIELNFSPLKRWVPNVVCLRKLRRAQLLLSCISGGEFARQF